MSEVIGGLEQGYVLQLTRMGFAFGGRFVLPEDAVGGVVAPELCRTVGWRMRIYSTLLLP